MRPADVIEGLLSLANPSNVEGQRRFGISGRRLLGISIPTLRDLAKRIGRDHEMAGALWASGIHEARILATMVEDPALVTEQQMEEWAAGFDSWDLCDQSCGNLFDRTALAYRKASEWAGREEEFVKRAGFALMATLAVHDKEAGDEAFLAFLPLIEREATDERNFLKKAVNWALRQIGKRSAALRVEAVEVANRIRNLDSRAARWVASDALRELTRALPPER